MTYTGTYSPEDNKLRLYASSRLDAETYKRVREAGFIWAPKQELFVAPSWTPGREDLLMELCGEIGDEDTSLVDRAEERADRFADYSRSRAEDAAAAHKAVDRIADGIPLGQPILVGHHSEKHARRDAEKIENGMRRAVKMWETAQYWKSRAAGAIRAAKYKELPAVRHRRIKKLESEKRGFERTIAECEKYTKLWEADGLTLERAQGIANFDHVSKCFTLAEYPREAPVSQYEGMMSLYSALEGIITPEQAREIAVRVHARSIAGAMRWLEHLNNRLEYERAMLGESGGLAADKFEIEPGGRVLAGGEWVTVIRVNRVGGAINSVRTNAKYCSLIEIERVEDYMPTEPEEAAAVKAATKLPPLVNFRAPGCVEMTTADWKNKMRWSSSNYVASFNASGGEPKSGQIGEGPVAYRQRSMSGGANRDWKRVPVFLTDAKEVLPPGSAAPRVKLPPPEKAESRRLYKAGTLEQLTEEHFEHRDSGKIIAGVKYTYSGEPESECYQFDSLEELLPYVRASQAEPRMLHLSVVTHAGEYKQMRTVYTWDRADEVFAGMQESLKAGVKVVSAPQLFPTPPELAERMVMEACIGAGHEVLEPSAGTGAILDAIKPTGARFFAVEVDHRLAENLSTRYTPPEDAAQGICKNVLQANFLDLDPGQIGLYDAVLINPPFADGADMRHIEHALNFVKPGGRLVAICANGPRQNAKLRPLIENAGGIWEALPPDTFKSSGTGVNTALIVLQK